MKGLALEDGDVPRSQVLAMPQRGYSNARIGRRGVRVPLLVTTTERQATRCR
jgi:hypothetical protein